MTIRVAVIEDDTETRTIISDWIRKAEGFCLVGVFSSPPVAIEQLPGLKPDVVLSDINMPEMSGTEGVRQLKVILPQTQFIMLTVYGDVDHIFDALAAGASGYLLKSTPRQELLDAVRDVSGGGSPMTSDVARKVVQSFRRSTLKCSAMEPLSDRERSVLELLAAGHLDRKSVV